LYELVLEKWWIKAICLAAAVGVFVFQRTNAQEERVSFIPLNVETSGDLVASSVYPKSVRVTIRGDAASISNIQNTGLEAYADFTKYNDPGAYKAPVSWRSSGTEDEVLEVSKIEPPEITLSLDHKANAFVPLTLDIEGSVDQGYALAAEPTITPNQVIIEGPKGHIAQVKELATDPVNLSGRTSDFSVAVKILNRDPLVTVKGNGTAEVRGVINRIVPVRNLQDVPIVMEGLDSKFSGELDIKAGRVHLEGVQTDLDHYKAPDDLLSVDCSSITAPGTYTLKVQMKQPPHLKATFDPADVSILVTVFNGLPVHTK
jgi:YbbR domain-containing protein